jgi:hypothetical protein
MISNRKKIRSVGGLLLEALMLLFIFTSSVSKTCHTDPHLKRGLVINAIPADQIAFRDSDSSSEILLNFVSKIQASDFYTSAVSIDLPAIELTNAEGFSVNPFLSNTFYTHITASAP